MGSSFGLARAAQEAVTFDTGRRASGLLAQSFCLLEQSLFKSDLCDMASHRRCSIRSRTLRVAKRFHRAASARRCYRLASAAAEPIHTNGTATQARPLTADEHSFEAQLRAKFATHVALRRSGKGGKIEIRFTNEKDLLRIADILLDQE